MAYFYKRGPRIRGGSFVRGRGCGFGMTYSRSDRNLLSDQNQDSGTDSSGCEDMFSDTHSVNWFQTVDRRRGKRRQQITVEERLSDNANDSLVEDETHSLGSEEKLPLILSKVSLNGNRLSRIEYKVNSVVGNQKRIKSVENVLKSYEDRIKLLE